MTYKKRSFSCDACVCVYVCSICKKGIFVADVNSIHVLVGAYDTPKPE